MESALQVSGLSKHFAGVLALDAVSVTVEPGQIHAIIGENGSGKSTFVKILGGYHTPEPGGVVSLWGEELSFPVVSPQHHGMAIVHQDLGLVDDLSVWENLGVGMSYGARMFSPFSRQAEEAIVRELSEQFGHTLDPRAKVGTLTRVEKSIVAIVRAIRELGVRGQDHLIILDEPTAALPRTEVERLLRFMRDLASKGAAVIFISHHLQEVMDCADVVTVFRSGRTVGTYPISEVSPGELVHLMLGYAVEELEISTREIPRLDGTPLVSVSGLSGTVVSDLSFEVRAGEVVGVTGLSGMGQEELPYLLTGAAAPRAGQVFIEGVPVIKGLKGAIAAGMVLVPANRARDGIWLDATATENVTLPVLGKLGRPYLRSKGAERRQTESLMRRLGARPLDPSLRISAFSGGNQQKLLMAKWLQTEPRVLVLHAPTQGVDAAGRRDVLHITQEAAQRGAAVILCTDDSEEIMPICQRVIVLRDGRIATTLVHSELTEHALLAACQAA
jgi:ribose transport system ATP-binding protein